MIWWKKNLHKYKIQFIIHFLWSTEDRNFFNLIGDTREKNQQQIRIDDFKNIKSI